MTIDATRRAIIAIPGITMISGCALLSSPDPEPLFRFGQSAVTDQIATEKTSAVLFAGVTFPRIAGSDRIVTVSSQGGDVSYIGGSRWAAPAVGLFDEAVQRAFDGSSVRLYRRGTASRVDATLRVEVQTFEARYQGPESAPLVVLELRALLTPTAAGSETVEFRRSTVRRAEANRVAAIAAAFDYATTETLGGIVGWTRANVRPAARG